MRRVRLWWTYKKAVHLAHQEARALRRSDRDQRYREWERWYDGKKAKP